MTVKIVRDATLKTLRNSVHANLHLYRNGSFDFLEADSSQFYELAVELDQTALLDLKLPQGGSLYELENCKAAFRYFGNLRPYDARDERLWVHASHTTFLSYSRARWPIPADDEAAVSHIRRHFFAQNNRQIERDNSVSRLWWMAHLCRRVVEIDQDAALDALLLRTDVRANIVERPTVAQSVNVFAAILKRLIASRAGSQSLFERAPFRRLMVELNSVGGFRLLDALPENELNAIFDDIIVSKLGLKTL